MEGPNGYLLIWAPILTESRAWKPFEPKLPGPSGPAVPPGPPR